MILQEYFNLRKDLLNRSKDEEGFIQQSLLLSEVLPAMLDAKLIDSEDYNESYYLSGPEKMKVNAYLVNESGERLQIFLVDENSIDLRLEEKALIASKKAYYENHFKRTTKFLTKAFKGQLNEEIQDSSPARALISQISSPEGADQFDVIEIFLISTFATVSLQTSKPSPKKIDFSSETININYSINNERKAKKLYIKKRLIDLNFLFDIEVSQGNREPLKVDFENIFEEKINAIKAADEDHFESYLCVLPAKILAGLYREYSTRLLEKNVRSFLQFRGVNKGIRETIRKEPEKFIAFNNGLTITATGGEIFEENGRVLIKSLTDFQIVNGGQTTATIYFTQKDGYKIDRVNVMAKINITKNSSAEELEDLISKISTYSNAQSRVSKVDLGSRNPQLVRIKSLSESVLTPSGLKWFFERAKGEFNTKMRIAGTNKNRLKKEFPTERRFSKELLGKYFCAWGRQPYMVKRGGEKVFRHFVAEISQEGESEIPVDINRLFYEELIAKVILFRKLEKIYGRGKNSMGQLRSAVIPYALSVVYSFTDGAPEPRPFDLLKIWKEEGLDAKLTMFFKELLQLVNELIKKYSKSDDYGEYSKKIELWNAIEKSDEIITYMSTERANQILKEYTISMDLKRKREKEVQKIKEVDFKNLRDNVLIHTIGDTYYRRLSETEFMGSVSSKVELHKLNQIGLAIANQRDLDKETLQFERDFVNKIRVEKPELFSELPGLSKSDFSLHDTLNYIVQEYNKVIEQGGDLVEEFKSISEMAEEKKVAFSSVFKRIGIGLSKGEAPQIKQLYQATDFLKSNAGGEAIKKDPDKVEFSEILLRKMIEWDIAANVLSENERQYIAYYAYGLKALKPSNVKHLRKHLKTMISKGFEL